MKILVVMDLNWKLKMDEVVEQYSGHQFDCCHSKKTFLSCIKKVDYELFLVFVRNGEEIYLLDEIRKEIPKNKKVVVVSDFQFVFWDRNFHVLHLDSKYIEEAIRIVSKDKIINVLYGQMDQMSNVLVSTSNPKISYIRNYGDVVFITEHDLGKMLKVFQKFLGEKMVEDWT